MIPNPLQPSLEKASRHSMAVNENQNDVLMELLLSFVKSHDSSWFPQQFYRQLMILLTSTTVHMQWILNYSPNSFECLSSEYFVVYLTYDTDAPISSRQQVTVAIIEAFELYNETYFLDSP